MELQDLIAPFAVALGVGLLIGLERGWRTREETAGSRTAHSASLRNTFMETAAAMKLSGGWAGSRLRNSTNSLHVVSATAYHVVASSYHRRRVAIGWTRSHPPTTNASAAAANAARWPRPVTSV